MSDNFSEVGRHFNNVAAFCFIKNSGAPALGFLTIAYFFQCICAINFGNLFYVKFTHACFNLSH